MKKLRILIVIGITLLSINGCAIFRADETIQPQATVETLPVVEPTPPPASLPKVTETSTLNWPTQAWSTSEPEKQQMDADSLAQMFQVIEEKQPSLHSVLVVRNGYIVAEKYYGIWGPNNKHTTQSITKSIVSALVGIALEQGCIKSLDDPIWRYFPERSPADNDARKQEITIKQLLMMASGIEWHDGQTPMHSSTDWVQFVLDQPMAAKPGTLWNYNSGNAHLLSAIIQSACGMNTLDYAQKYLFAPLGITNVQWEKDPQGIPDGCCGISLTPRDMAKIGILYLNGGTWDGKQILAAEWVKASTQKYFQVPKPLEPWNLYYGYTWWIHGDGPYAAHGRGGQFIYVIPEQNMVVTFTSDVNTPDIEFTQSQLLIREYIIPAVK